MDKEEEFVSVFNQFCTWLEDQSVVRNNLAGHDSNGPLKFTFVTCGDWDLNYMLPTQCITSKITLPAYF